MNIDKSLPHCWKLAFRSGPSKICYPETIDAIEALEFHTEQAANDSADYLAMKDIVVSVYCIQKEGN